MASLRGYLEGYRAVCLGACAALVLGAGVVTAASPQVDLAIKAVEAVGNDPGKLKLFCQLNKLLQAADQLHADRPDRRRHQEAQQLGGVSPVLPGARARRLHGGGDYHAESAPRPPPRRKSR